MTTDSVLVAVTHPEFSTDECKGCGLCVAACPAKCLEMSGEINRKSVPFTRYRGQGCTGCGICFYSCPEPYAIRILKKDGK